MILCNYFSYFETEDRDMNATTSTTVSSKDLASSLSGGVKAFLAVTFGKEGAGILTRIQGLLCAFYNLQPYKKDHQVNLIL